MACNIFTKLKTKTAITVILCNSKF